MTKQTFIGGLLSEIEVNRKKIRDFGLVMLFVPGILIPVILSWLADWSIPLSAALISGTGIFLFLFAMIRPMALRGVYKAWMLLAFLLALLTTKITISLVYFLVMTPIGLYRQFKKKDPLAMKPDAGQQSYWVTRKKPHTEPSSYEKQY